MKVKTGYLYHIKDEFFDLVEDKNLMTNHERGRTRPTYFTVKDEDILWFIPLSSKVEKYKRIRDKKIKRYGECNTILIQKNSRTRYSSINTKCFSYFRKIYRSCSFN